MRVLTVRGALVALARTTTAKANRDVGPRVNFFESNMTSRLRYFVRINTPTFLGSKVGEDFQEFLDGVYKVLSVME